MSNPDCTAGCGFICTCGDIDYSRENELAAETTRLRQQLAIAMAALKKYADWEKHYGGSKGSAQQALAQIRELEK